jgi:hypothetical protein
MKPAAFKIAIALGILLLGLAVSLLIINPKPENNLYGGFRTPILEMEFAQKTEHIKTIFSVKDPIHYEQQFLLGNWIDYGFMLTYSLFLFFISLGIYKLAKSNAILLAFFLCLLMLAADAFENMQIFNIILHYKKGDISPNLEWMHLFTWVKWGSIAAVFILFSPFFFSGTIFQKIAGLFQLACFGLAIAAFILPGVLSELFALSVSINFLLLFVFSILYKQPATI